MISPKGLAFVGVPYGAKAGTPSYFTSWGGTNDLALKPDIAAPGSDIFSTYPGNSYALMSGTSMVTPYIAGVAALYVEPMAAALSTGPASRARSPRGSKPPAPAYPQLGATSKNNPCQVYGRRRRRWATGL